MNYIFQVLKRYKVMQRFRGKFMFFWAKKLKFYVKWPQFNCPCF